jgi:uncharacterized membrane protein
LLKITAMPSLSTLAQSPMFYVWGTLFAVGGFVVGALIAAVAVVLMPADYFDYSAPRPRRSMPLHILKNVVGAVLVVLGIAMLVMPGQGVLTIVAGLMLVDFPGKHQLVGKLLTRPRLMESANRLRVRFGKAPFQTPHRVL